MVSVSLVYRKQFILAGCCCHWLPPPLSSLSHGGPAAGPGVRARVPSSSLGRLRAATVKKGGLALDHTIFAIVSTATCTVVENDVRASCSPCGWRRSVPKCRFFALEHPVEGCSDRFEGESCDRRRLPSIDRTPCQLTIPCIHLLPLVLRRATAPDTDRLASCPAAVPRCAA